MSRTSASGAARLAGLIRGKGERFQECVEPAARACSGQHPPDLGRGRLARGVPCRHQPRSPPGDQAEQHGQRLVVAEHERRQAVAGGEPVAAVATAHRLDGYVKIDQVVHIPPHGPPLNAEPVGEFGHRPGAARLQQLQKRQHAAGGSRHVPQVKANSGPILSAVLLACDEQRFRPPKEITMDFVSIRIITGDVARLVEFYERATGVRAVWATDDFAELRTPSATLAIGGTRTVPLFAPGSARPAANQSVITEFLVDDVDRVHQNLTGFVTEFVNEPAHDAVGQPLPAVPRPRRQPRQLLHPRHRGRHREVRPLTPRGESMSRGFRWTQAPGFGWSSTALVEPSAPRGRPSPARRTP